MELGSCRCATAEKGDPRRGKLVTLAISDFATIAAVRGLLGFYPHWEGSASELLEVFTRSAWSEERQHPSWPRSGRGLARELRRLAPILEALGTGVAFGRRTHGGKRLVVITRRSYEDYNYLLPEPPPDSGPDMESDLTPDFVTQDDHSSPVFPAEVSETDLSACGGWGDDEFRESCRKLVEPDPMD